MSNTYIHEDMLEILPDSGFHQNQSLKEFIAVFQSCIDLSYPGNQAGRKAIDHDESIGDTCFWFPGDYKSIGKNQGS
jgi:hypothetical protein